MNASRRYASPYPWPRSGSGMLLSEPQLGEVRLALFEEGTYAFTQLLGLLRAHHVLHLQFERLFQRVARCTYR